MTISNKNKISSLRRLFFLVCLVIALGTLILFLLDLIIPALAMAGVFALWFLYFKAADHQYIEFKIENNKIILRYYKAVSFGKTKFNSIEFPQHMLYHANFENSAFGKMSDLTLVVKTSKGIAEYPSVSLTALSKEDRIKLKEMLTQILIV